MNQGPTSNKVWNLFKSRITLERWKQFCRRNVFLVGKQNYYGRHLFFEPAPGIRANFYFLSFCKSYANSHFTSKICELWGVQKVFKNYYWFNILSSLHRALQIHSMYQKNVIPPSGMCRRVLYWVLPLTPLLAFSCKRKCCA